MNRCPICSHEHEAEEIRDGRCPNCGGIVAWNDDSDQVPAHIEAAIARATIAQHVDRGRGLDVERDSPAAIRASLTDVRASGLDGGVPGGLDAGVHGDADDPRRLPVPALPLAGPDGGTPGSSAASPSSPVNSGGGTGKPDTVRTNKEGTVEQRLPAFTPEVERHVTAMWEDAVGEDSHTGNTLKGKTKGSSTDTKLVIKSRDLRTVSTTERQSPFATGAEYELLEVIGVGGVGVVYSARQSSIDRNVAVKMLKAERATDAGHRDKFLAEAVVTGDLDHPNIVPIYDLGSDPSGALFYSMKHVQGTPWSSVLTKKTLDENLEILLKVSDAIAFAHARGVVHRDIKPENVMLGEFGEVLVMDWGIALPTKRYRKSGGILESQGLGGTPAYMSPEMVTGPIEKIGPPADVYLLGAVLYEVLTGQPPHQGRNVMACIMAAAKNTISPTEKSGELLDIALRAMATDPRDRYFDVRDLQAAIRAYQSHSESILLSTRAADEFHNAQLTDKYEDYARAVFAYEEAYELWNGNDEARVGAGRAKKVYAECALRKGDYDLGLSLLDGASLDHAPVRAQLLAAQRERDARQLRLRRVKQLVAALLVFIFAIGSVALVVIIGLWKQADLATDEALKAKKVADKQRDIAKERSSEAVRQREKADLARQDAEEAYLEAEQQNQRVERSVYFGEIGLANEDIANSAFDSAFRLLGRQTESVQSRYRHWEWGRLAYLCRELPGDPTVWTTRPQWSVATAATSDASTTTRDAKTQRPQSAGATAPDGATEADGDAAGADRLTASSGVSAAALSITQELAAVSGGGGYVQLVDWRARQERPAQSLWQGSISGLAFWRKENADYLVVSGAEGAQGCVRVYKVSDDGLVEVARCADSQWRRATCVAVSASANGWVAFGADSHHWYRWDWANNTAPQSMGTHGDVVTAITIAPDDARVATASLDGSARVWEARRVANDKEGNELKRFEGHQSPVFCVAFTPDGKYALSGGYDQKVRIWDAPPAGSPRVPIRQRAESIVQGLDVVRRDEPSTNRGTGANGEAVGANDSGDVTSAFVLGKNQISGHRGTVRAISISADGKSILTAGRDNLIIVWDYDAKATSMTVRKILRGHGGWVESATLSRDGSFALSASNDGSWRWWDVAHYSELHRYAGRTGIQSVRFAHDGQMIVAARDDGEVLLIHYDPVAGLTAEPMSGAAELSDGHVFLVTTGLFLDGDRVLTAAGDNTVRIWDGKRGVEVLRMDDTGGRGLAAATHDGRRILTGSSRKTLTCRDATGKILWEGSHVPAALAQFISRRTADSDRADAAGATGRFVTTDKTDDTDKTDNTDAGASVADATRSASAVQSDAAVDGELRRRIPDVSAMALSVDGKMAVSGDTVGMVRVWDGDSGRLLQHWKGHQYAVTAVAVGPYLANGDQLAFSAGSDGNIVSWNLRQGSKDRTWRHPDGGAVSALAISDDGKTMLTASPTRKSPGALWLWRLDDNSTDPARVPVEAMHDVIDIAFETSDVPSALLVTADSSGLNRLWRLRLDTRELAPLGNEPLSRGSVWAVTPSQDGRQLLTVGGKGARIWNMPEGQLVSSLRPQGPLVALDVSTGRNQVAAGSRDGTIRLWDLKTKRSRQTLLGHSGAVADVRYSPDGSWLLSVGADGLVRTWDLRADPIVPRTLFKSPHPVHFGVWTGDSHDILVGDAQGLVRRISWQPAQPESPAVVDDTNMVHRGALLSAALSPDGRWLLVGSEDKLATLWDLTTERPLAVLEHSGPVRTVAFSSDGLRLLTGGRDLALRLWDVQELARLHESTEEGDVREVLKFLEHGQEITSAQFSADGRFVLSADADGVILVRTALPVDPALVTSAGAAHFDAKTGPAPVDDKILVSFPTPGQLAGLAVTVQVGARRVTHAPLDTDAPADSGGTEDTRNTEGTGSTDSTETAETAYDILSIPEGDLPGSNWTVTGETLMRKSDQQVLARFQGGRDSMPLVVEFVDGIQSEPRAAQELLRQIRYERSREPDSDEVREATFVLSRDGAVIGVAAGQRRTLHLAGKQSEPLESTGDLTSN